METTFELSPKYGLKYAEVTDLLKIGEKQLIHKGESIISFDGFDNNIYFVLEGILHAYMPIEGNDLTIWFTLPGEFVVDMWCYKYNRRSPIGIDAATDVSIIKISKADFDYWNTISIQNAITARKIFEGYLSIYEQALFEYFGCSTAKERYMMIMRLYPEIIKHIPLKQLASYLWITPQSLSRIRRSIK